MTLLVLWVAVFIFAILAFWVTAVRRNLTRSPVPVTRATKLFQNALRDLELKHGAGVAIPCGDTAEYIEKHVVFTNCLDSELAPASIHTSKLFRLHFEVDADNVSNDHVVFLIAFPDYALILHSYIDELPVTIERRPWSWVYNLQAMVRRNDASQWTSLFGINPARSRFVPPYVVHCHYSYGFV